MVCEPNQNEFHTFDHPTIGSIKGRKSSPQVVKYLGVPYATLSDGFARGTLVDSVSSQDVLDATNPGPVVLQPLDACEREQRMIQAYLPFLPLKQSATEGLTLSINVPNVIISVEKLPVIVFVHGGGFANGSAYHPTYDLTRFTQLSVDMDMAVIAVGVNYRVGIPGFLNSEEMRSLGYEANNALDDQRLALRWIKKHIAGFGGDSERVTFMGQSAGGVAGSIHLQSKEPLFQQYVSMSGTCFLRPRSAAAVQTAYDTLVRDLGFADFNPQEQMDRILEDNEQGKLRGLSRKYNLGPTVDGKIVPEALDFRSLVEPAQALHSLPGLRYCRMLLIGDSGFDGMAFSSRLAGVVSILPKALVDSLHKQLDPLDQNFVPFLVSEYGLDVEASSNTEESTRPVLNLGNDILYAIPAITLAKLWSGSTVEGTRSFLYHFNCPNPWPGPWKGEASHVLDVALALQNHREQLNTGQRQCGERFGKDLIRFVNGLEVWQEYEQSTHPTSMVYTATIDGQEDDSTIAYDANSKHIGRRTAMQQMGELVHDKVMHSWEASMGGTRTSDA